MEPLQPKAGQLSSEMNMPTDFQFKPQSIMPAASETDIVGNIGAGIQGVRAHNAPRAHQQPTLQQLNARSEELDVAEAAQALNANSSSQILGPQ